MDQDRVISHIWNNNKIENLIILNKQETMQQHREYIYTHMEKQIYDC